MAWTFNQSRPPFNVALPPYPSWPAQWHVPNDGEYWLVWGCGIGVPGIVLPMEGGELTPGGELHNTGTQRGRLIVWAPSPNVWVPGRDTYIGAPHTWWRLKVPLSELPTKGHQYRERAHGVPGCREDCGQAKDAVIHRVSHAPAIGVDTVIAVEPVPDDWWPGPW